MGYNNNRFIPKAYVTRGEISTILYRYIKLTIHPSTAQGWVQNDEGGYLYYEEGKFLTGWQDIDGIWYYFNKAGIMQPGRKKTTEIIS